MCKICGERHVSVSGFVVDTDDAGTGSVPANTGVCGAEPLDSAAVCGESCCPPWAGGMERNRLSFSLRSSVACGCSSGGAAGRRVARCAGWACFPLARAAAARMRSWYGVEKAGPIGLPGVPSSSLAEMPEDGLRWYPGRRLREPNK